MKPKDKKEAHVYFDDKTFKRLKRLADFNRRSISAEIVIAVEQRIERCKQKGQDV